MAQKLDHETWKAKVLSSVDPKRTVLAVIDVQNDFCSKEGALAQLGYDVEPCAEVATRISEALPQLRRVVEHVSFFRLVYEPSQMSASQKERLIRDNGKPVICSPEGTGTELYGLQPESTDAVLVKHRYSAFTSASFREALKKRNIDTVIVVGVDTHICVEDTTRHGYDLGYRMIVLSDLVGTHRRDHEAHLRSLVLMEKYFGLVETAANVIDALSRPGTPRARS